MLIKDALWRRGEPKNVLIYLDQSSQYRSMDYQLLLKEYDLECSMSRKGNGHDNTVMESFFHTLKNELENHQRYKNPAEAK